MPLNYSKWDMLELSDDSDIEEHPNVDKKSMIRWKQRDIHEKREARKLLIAKLKSELALNAVLRPRIQAVLSPFASSDPSSSVERYRAVQRRLRESPSPEKPATGAANQPTYDMMLEQLLRDVWREAALLTDGAEERGGAVYVGGKAVNDKTEMPAWAEEHLPAEGKREGVARFLEARLRWHVAELDKRDAEVKKEIATEEAEQGKKITSEGIKEGWSASSVNKNSKPSPIENKGLALPKSQEKGKGKGKEEHIEVLNPGAGSAGDVSTKEDGDDDDITIGPLTQSQRGFANIGLGDFEKSYAFLRNDSSVLTEQTHDSLLGEAFDAERRGEKKFAKQCVHQALLVNYCRQLGRDGVGLFFQKMIQRNPKSISMFTSDVDATYTRIATRTQEMIAEEAANGGGADDGTGEREQIQLYAEDPNMVISFNLPDGPPPAELRVEGEGAEELDMEQVRAFLQRKWDIYQGFPEPLREALGSEKLDEVNRVLGRMKVAEAEEVVELMQEGGMLSFSERGVRDMTK